MKNKKIKKLIVESTLVSMIFACPEDTWSFNSSKKELKEPFKVKISATKRNYLGQSLKIIKKYPNNKIYQYVPFDFSSDPDDILLARMIFGEMAGYSKEEKIAVAYTAINRKKIKTWMGKTLNEVILKELQYSCFNKDDFNRYKVMNPKKYGEVEWKKSIDIARKVLSKKYRDPTNGATHYHHKSMDEYPEWAYKLKKIRTPEKWEHYFYKN